MRCGNSRVSWNSSGAVAVAMGRLRRSVFGSKFFATSKQTPKFIKQLFLKLGKFLMAHVLPSPIALSPSLPRRLGGLDHFVFAKSNDLEFGSSSHPA